MVNSNETYQGWTNRETWAAHLWLSNNQDSYKAYKGLSAEQIRVGLTEWLCLPHEQEWDIRQSMLLDIGSLWRVNWHEIADALKD